MLRNHDHVLSVGDNIRNGLDVEAVRGTLILLRGLSLGTVAIAATRFLNGPPGALVHAAAVGKRNSLKPAECQRQEKGRGLHTNSVTEESLAVFIMDENYPGILRQERLKAPEATR